VITDFDLHDVRQAAGQGAELQFLQQVEHLFGLAFGAIDLFEIEFHWRVGPDPGQLFTQVSQFFAFFQLAAGGIFNQRQVFVNSVQRFILLDEFQPAFLADARHARNVVGAESPLRAFKSKNWSV
jgi:hypothetical protein